MGTYKWGYKSPNMEHKYSYSAYSRTYNYPWTSHWCISYEVNLDLFVVFASFPNAPSIQKVPALGFKVDK